MLRSIEWQFHTEVSGQPTCPNFKGQKAQKVLDFLVEYGTDNLYRNVGTELPLCAV